MVLPFSKLALGDPPGWKLVLKDDFTELDKERWQMVTSHEPTNNSLEAYLPSQVSVEDGMLVITSEKKPSGNLQYSSGKVVSKLARRLGRWEVRAKLPTTAGMWPAIWLLPDVDKVKWPSGGEIDIMENRGNQPALTSSAFHFGTNPPYKHQYVFGEHQAKVGGEVVVFSEDFHTYAVEWTEDSLCFYVDDVQHSSVHDEDVQGFLSTSTKPMQLVINTAVGGDFLPNPDATTVWPQRFEIDWVRIYEPAPTDAPKQLVNGGFEEQGGTLAGWMVFGNKVPGNPNVSAADEAVSGGARSLKLFGNFGAGAPYSGVSQGITVEQGQQIKATAESFISSDDSIVNTDNSVTMKMEIYSKVGTKFGSAAMLAVEELVIASGDTKPDVWRPHELTLSVPDQAVEARITFVFHQPAASPGAVHIDNVQFHAE